MFKVCFAAVHPSEICKQYNSGIDNSGPRKVFDLFLASNEIDMMEVRIMELMHVVDLFVIIESRMNFRGRTRSLAFPQVLHRLPGDAIAKIHYRVLDKLVGHSTQWDKEQYQRNQLFNISSMLSIRDGDILMLSDCDEIPRPSFVAAMKYCQLHFPMILESTLHYYSFEYDGVPWTLGPRALLYTSNRLPVAAEFRGNCPRCKLYRNTSWHCSFCFKKIRAVQEKISSFSHSELDNPDSRSLENILTAVRTGRDLFNRSNVQFKKSGIVDAPLYILENPTRFSYMLKRDAVDAGFIDLGVNFH